MLNKSSLKPALIPASELEVRYQLSLAQVEELLARLSLETEQIDGEIYLTSLQLDLLDSLKPQFSRLHEFIDNLPEAAFLYRCSLCGHLFLSGDILMDERLLHSCNPLKLKEKLSLAHNWNVEDARLTLGKYELLACGPIDRLIQWTHSVYIGVDKKAGI